MTRPARLLTLALGLLIFAPSLAAEQDSPDRALEIATVVAEPWTYFDRDCQVTGIVHSLLDRAAERTGLRFNLQLHDAASLAELSKNGDIDIRLVARGAAETYGLKGRYLVDIVPLQIVLYGTLPEHGEARIGGLDWALFDALAVDQEISFTILPDYRTGVEQLLSGELDALSGPAESILFNCFLTDCSVDQLGASRVLTTVDIALFRLDSAKHRVPDQQVIDSIQSVRDLGILNLLKLRYFEPKLRDDMSLPGDCPRSEH